MVLKSRYESKIFDLIQGLPIWNECFTQGIEKPIGYRHLGSIIFPAKSVIRRAASINGDDICPHDSRNNTRHNEAHICNSRKNGFREHT